MIHSHRAIAALLPLFVAACGGGGSDSPPPAPPPVATPKACTTDALAGITLANAALTAASGVAAGTFAPPTGAPQQNLPAFCRITAQATPTTSSLINFEVWVPEGTAWNGKLVVTGNGGYSPTLNYGDMAYAMRQGYAVVGGDTGHQSADPNAMFWASTSRRRSPTGARARSMRSPDRRARSSKASRRRRRRVRTTTAARPAATRPTRRSSATPTTSTA